MIYSLMSSTVGRLAGLFVAKPQLADRLRKPASMTFHVDFHLSARPRLVAAHDSLDLQTVGEHLVRRVVGQESRAFAWRGQTSVVSADGGEDGNQLRQRDIGTGLDARARRW